MIIRDPGVEPEARRTPMARLPVRPAATGARKQPSAPLRRRAARVPVVWLKAGVWLVAVGPFLLLLRDAFTDGLGAEPIEAITHRTGWWALTLLMVTLAVSPVRRLTGWNPLIRLRRPLGLFAFFYAVLHVGTYAFDQEFTPAYMLEDVLQRPYVTAGFAAFLLLVPLAATSTRGMIRRLGRNWRRLHRLVYAAAALGVLHFLWLVKADVREPLFFGAMLLILLALRLPLPWRARRPG